MMSSHEEILRDRLRSAFPSCAFLKDAPNGAGFSFGWKAGAVIPTFCVRYLDVMTEHLSPANFEACVAGIVAFCEKVLELATDEGVTEEHMGAAREHVDAVFPGIGEILEDVFDF